MIPANLRLMLSLRFSGKNAGVAQKTSENKPDPRTGHAREGVRHPKHRLEALPPYAPDLNPVEWLWKHLKKVELRNLTCLDLEQLHMELHLALGRVRRRLALVRSFFEGAGLEL